jgi:UDP-N-acetylglucosamine--N-acetylmuramyl-(pentapeptide) pyrophosphoryl-undecaprenol N-acetylglucosamine transferase
VSNLLFPLKAAVGIMQSFILMKKLKPDVVVGTGGYVCGPPLYAASVLGIPTLIQEQNSYPGVTTRKLATRVNEVHLTFENSKRYLTRLDNVKVSGNPTSVRLGTVSREEGAKHLDLDATIKTLLVFGGSLGAASINNEIENILLEVMGWNVQLIWQTGQSDFDRIEKIVARKLDEAGSRRVRVHKFIERMDLAYAAADLAVCRAGASTLAELMVVGLPSILVPYPFAAADHQTENARAMVEANAAMMVKDSELRERLLTTLRELIGDETKLATMSAKAKSLGRPDAARVIADAVLALANA